MGGTQELFEKSHTQRNRFFDIPNGVDQAERIRVGEIDEVLIEDLVGAIAHEKVAGFVHGPAPFFIALQGCLVMAFRCFSES